ncbi:MAG: right-handed parallel beta-helix repeat-containing protein [Sulfurimicrobium sp.]|nr:right-handed parallel beta-helix repeat-containing protein [Sulfurimicrobium sp.]
MKGVLLSGAQTGLTLRDAAGVIENVSVTDNEIGIHISGLSGVVVRNCWVAGNKTGIALVGADAKIVQSTIARNGTGLSLKGFFGEVSENVIIDNEQNIFSDFPLKLDPNYIGQSQEFGMPRYAGSQWLGNSRNR